MNERWLIPSFTASSLIHLGLIPLAALIIQAKPIKPVTVPIELVDVPTFGISSLSLGDLNRDHLMRLERAIMSPRTKHVFVPDRVGKLMRASGEFPWMPLTPASDGGPLKIWHRNEHTTVYWHYHFSVYGKFEEGKRNQLAAMRKLIEDEERITT